MQTTNIILLDLLKNPGAAAADWNQFWDFYAPLVRKWLFHLDIVADADDLAQEAFVVLLTQLATFEHRGKNSFRGFLKKIVLNRVRAFRKARKKQPPIPWDDDLEKQLSQLDDPNSPLSGQWDTVFKEGTLPRLLAQLQAKVEPQTWEAFKGVHLDGKRPAQVAAELGMSAHAVRMAKSRVLSRLREEGKKLQLDLDFS